MADTSAPALELEEEPDLLDNHMQTETLAESFHTVCLSSLNKTLRASCTSALAPQWE